MMMSYPVGHSITVPRIQSLAPRVLEMWQVAEAVHAIIHNNTNNLMYVFLSVCLSRTGLRSWRIETRLTNP